MKILLTGADGQVGKSCQSLWQHLPSHLQSLEGDVVCAGRSVLDITSESDVMDFVQQERPDALINCAAFTAVDKAESEPNMANAVNHLGPKHLALACQSIGAALVHLSTDYVYEQSSNGAPLKPFDESDRCLPMNTYGETKLLGENAVLSLCKNSFVVRTAWVFSADGHNFVKTMLKLAKTRDELSVVCDQVGCPTFAGDIALAIAELLACHQRAVTHNPQSGQTLEPPWGIYNYCGDVGVSWHEFARRIFSTARQQGLLTSEPKLNGILTEQYPTPARRPAYSVMNTRKIERLGVAASPWMQRLDESIAEMFHGI